MIPHSMILAAAMTASQVGDDDAWTYLAAKYDKDQDGVITRKEYDRDEERWKLLDTNADGQIDRKEVEARARKPKQGGLGRAGEPPQLGAIAPDFELDVLPPDFAHAAPDDAKDVERVRLSSFRGKRPVALIFGSYT